MRMRIEYSALALADLQRLSDFLLGTDAPAAEQTAALIVEAVSLLKRHPQVGRPYSQGLRELVMSRGRSGYVSLYRVDALMERMLVLTIKHQREKRFEGGFLKRHQHGFTAHNFSVSPDLGCHFIKRFSSLPTATSSSSANTVSTRIPAITVLMSNAPSACKIR